jgi:hypothetical protein
VLGVSNRSRSSENAGRRLAMRSTAISTLVALTATLSVFVVSSSYASDGEATYQHTAKVKRTFERQCMEGTENSAFCDCAMETLNTLVPPEYASILSVSLRRGRVLSIFELHPDTPGYLEDQIDEEVTYCRETFAETPPQ